MALLEMQVVVEVLEPDAQGLGLGGLAGEFGVEIQMWPACEVIEFAIEPHARLWPDIAEKKRFAPAGMREDEIGRIALVAQSTSRVIARLAARHLGIEIDQPRVQALPLALGQAIGDHAHPLPGRGLLHPQRQRHALMPLPGQKRGQMLVLAWEILMDEKDLHGYARLVPLT